jgi:putative ABC transport system permease protein
MSSDRMAWGAIGAVSRHGLRRHWSRLLVLGLAAGLLGSAVLAAAAVARRTATAHDRLAAATHVEDAEVSVFGDPGLVDDVRAFTGIERSTTATLFVGALGGPGVSYLAVRSSDADGLGEPAVVSGRPADPASGDEVVVTEQLADALGLVPGDDLPLCLLTRDEFASFDTGFGEPDGPCLQLQVTGIGRTVGSDRSTSVFAGPGLAAALSDDLVAGRVVDLRLDRGVELGALVAQVDALAAAHPPPAGAEEFPVVALATPAEVRSTASATARVLVGGLVLCAVVAALVGLLLLGQALGRRFEGEAADQAVEAALGLTPGERAMGRVLPGLLAAGVAAVVAALGALVAGAVEPLGPLADLEPTPGWAPNVGLAATGGLLVATTVLALIALAARRAGRKPRATTTSGRRLARRPPVPGGVVAATGAWLAFGRRSGRARLPVRATLATVVIGVAGVTAALTVSASLDRVGADPSRFGWNGDVVVVDARAEVVADVRRDPRVGSTVWLHQVEGTLDGRATTLVSFEVDEPGAPVWTIHRGHLPTSDDEVLLGTRLAGRLDASVGEVVRLALLDGGERELTVTGIGIGPVSGPDGLGTTALVRPGALDGGDVTAAFDELLVRAADGTDRDALLDDLAGRYEVNRPAPPASVQDVLDLDRVPDLLAAYLAVVALAALANGMAVVVGRRGPELATLRAIGLTPAQMLWSVLVAALATVAIGLVVGIPLGLGIGRLVWWGLTDRIGLATDIAVPAAGIAMVGVGALVVTGLAAALPAWRAARLRPGTLLRTE